MIQREISRVLVLNLSGKISGAIRTAQGQCALDNAFALIVGTDAPAVLPSESRQVRSAQPGVAEIG